MELLVAVLDPVEDLEASPRSEGGVTWIAWKRRSSERSFSMYLRYSLSVVAPMQEISPRDSAGFRMLAASSEPSAEPAPISEWISSMKTMRSGFSLQLLEDPLQALLELAAVLGAGDDQREVEGEDLASARGRSAPRPSTMRWRQTLDDGGLADARLAEQDRVVLGAAREDLDDALDLLLAADQRVEGAARRRARSGRGRTRRGTAAPSSAARPRAP